jgi:hypothetical protein
VRSQKVLMYALKPHTAMVGAPRLLVNAALFNISWLAIVVAQSSAIGLLILGLHLWAHRSLVGLARREWRLIGVVTVIGALFDQSLFFTGVLNLDGWPARAPLWMTCLWPVFATTLMHAFAGLQRKTLIAAVLGAGGGALSYMAGARLTDVEFASTLWGPMMIALSWAVLLPLLLKLAARLADVRDPLQSWEAAPRRALD